MITLKILCLSSVLVAGPVHANAQNIPDDLVFVRGGTFTNPNSSYYGKHVKVSSFYIGKCEVTQRQWVDVMANDPAGSRGSDLPVETVTWYDCVEYCNKRSVKEHLHPFYKIDKKHRDPSNKRDPSFENDLDTVKWTVTVNPSANGYRLPTEAEWEYAAFGGQKSKGYEYAGSNSIDAVAWYWKNSGDTVLEGLWQWAIIKMNHGRTHSVAGKAQNELGLYDMSGDVREWCWDWYGPLKSNATDPQGSPQGFARVWKGGGWLSGDVYCKPSYRGHLAANGAGPDQGFRVCRNG